METGSERPNQQAETARVEPVVAATLPGAPDVYLVPGTWAAGIFRTIFARSLAPAPWTQVDSDFIKCAQASLPGSAVFRVIWRGRNRVSDRSKAADALREKINQDPEKAKIIICHSHGGNIALELLSQGALGVEGVVCMNTPFFAYLIRNTHDAFHAAFFLLALSGMIWMSALKGASFLLFAVMWSVLLVLSIITGESWISAKKQKYETDRSSTNVGDCRFLCLTTYEDEAFAFLNLADAVGNLPFLLLGKWSPWLFWVAAIGLTSKGWLPLIEIWSEPGLSPPLSEYAWAALGALVVVVLAVLAALISRSFPDKWSPWTFAVLAIFLTSPWWLLLLGLPWHLALLYLVSGLAWAGLTFLFLLVLAWPAVVVSRFFAQGIWDPIAPYFVRTLVTLTPLAARRVKFAEFKPPRPKEMNHSMLYGDADRTWQEIKKWREEEFGC